MPVQVRAVSSSSNQWVPYGNTTQGPPVEAFILGTTKPGPTNTGYTPGTVFTVVNGNQTITGSDLVIENRRYTGGVTVTGQNITFKNCWFNSSNTITRNVLVNGTAENVTFERCTFRPSSFSDDIAENIRGFNFTLYRCDLSGAVDGVALVKAGGGDYNINVYGCWIHDLGYWSPHPLQDDNQTHNDLFQIHNGGNNIHIRGNRLDGTVDPTIGNANEPSVDSGATHISGNKYYPAMIAMSVVMASPVNTSYGLQNFIFEENWMDYGQVGINWPRRDAINVQIINNRWGRNIWLSQAHTILAYESQPMTITGNYYEDNNQPYNGRIKGGN